MPELLPAVTVPPSGRKAGRSRASASSVVSARGCSSRSTTSGSPFRCGTAIGTIWSSNRPASMAATARCWLSSANASWRSRRHAPALGDVLGGLAHRVRVVPLGEPRVDEPPAEGRVGQLARAAVARRLGLELDVRRARHRLDAAADEHVAVADRDRVRRGVDRLEARAAQPVDGQAADLDREVGQQQRHPGDVAVVLAGLVGAAEDDVLDEGRVDAGAVDDGAQHGGGEVVRPDARERAAVAADRRADGLDDPGLADGAFESRVMRSMVATLAAGRHRRGRRRLEPRTRLRRLERARRTATGPPSAAARSNGPRVAGAEAHREVDVGRVATPSPRRGRPR